MALINCEECGKEISDKASACPHCGAPVDNQMIERKKFEQKQQAEIEEQEEREERERLNRVKVELKQKEAPLGNVTSIAAGWGLGVIFALNALMSISEGNLKAGCLYLLSSFFLLPPIRKKVHAKTNIVIAPNYRIAIVGILMFLAILAKNSAENERNEEAIQKVKEEEIKRQSEKRAEELQDFNVNKDKILNSVSDRIKSKSFKDAIDTCNTYMKLNDKDLAPLCTTVKTEFLKIEQKELEERAKKAATEAVKARAREEAELKASIGTKAWKLHKKHPEWSVDDCKGVANGKIWIGMSTNMLVASHGSRPDSANPSNYGNGTRWQYCWHDYTPSCFYDDNNDGIIDSYN